MALRIKNWTKFQHYKFRNPPWIKLHIEILSSEDWVTLDDAGKLLAVVCILIASKNQGSISLTPTTAAYFKRVAYLDRVPNFKPLIECGFLIDTLAVASDRTQLRTNADTETETETEKKVPDALASKNQEESEEENPADEAPRARLFREGKVILVALGIAPKQSGSIIGKWLKTTPDCDGVLAALNYAYQNNVMEPIGYVTKLLNTGGKGNGRGREGFDERIKRLADEARSLERAAGIAPEGDHKRSH